MTPDQARNLQPGDKIIIADMAATVYRVDQRPNGTLDLHFKLDAGGYGTVSGDFIDDIVAVPTAEPAWYGALMR